MVSMRQSIIVCVNSATPVEYRYFNTNACNPWEILQPVRTGRARVNGVGGVGWGGELSVMGDDAGLYRPCWDCGRRTGAWCNGGTATGRCSAAAVCPAEQWGQGQATPLCTTCDTVHGRCHTCRGVSGCRPFAWGQPGGGTQAGPYSLIVARFWQGVIIARF